MKTMFICLLIFVCILLCVGCGLTEQIEYHSPTKTVCLDPPSAPKQSDYPSPTEQSTKSVTVPTEFIKVTPLELLSVDEVESITGMSYYIKDDPYLVSDVSCHYLTEIHDVKYDVSLAVSGRITDTYSLEEMARGSSSDRKLTKIEGIGDEAYFVEDTGNICFSRGMNYFEVGYTFEYNDKTVQLCKTVCDNFDRYCGN